MKIFANIFLFFYFVILALGFNNTSFSKDFYAISFNSIEGDKIFLSNYRNKVILVVNTASFCGFTGQFKGIQNIWRKYKSDGLIVIGVPSNDFGQEAKTNSEVKNFCSMNFDVDFLRVDAWSKAFGYVFTLSAFTAFIAAMSQQNVKRSLRSRLRPKK